MLGERFQPDEIYEGWTEHVRVHSRFGVTQLHRNWLPVVEFAALAV